MSGGNAPAGNITSTQTAPAYMLPYMGTAAGQAANLLQGGGINPYPNQQVANFNPIQSQAFTNTNNLDNTLASGSGNPFENAMFNQAAQATQGQLSSEFAGSGRNLDASMPLRSDQLNNLATNFYGNNYQNSVNNAMNATQQQQALGGQIQNQGQNLINASMNSYNQSQQQPYQNLGQYEGFLQGLQPGSQTSNPYFTNPTATGLGALLAGKQLFGGSGGSTAATTAGSKG